MIFFFLSMTAFVNKKDRKKYFFTGKLDEFNNKKNLKIFTFFNEYFKFYFYLFKSRDKHYLT